MNESTSSNHLNHDKDDEDDDDDDDDEDEDEDDDDKEECPWLGEDDLSYQMVPGPP